MDLERARSAPGVIAVYTGDDLAKAKVGGLPCGWLITGADGKPMKEPPHPPLAQGKVRHVGDQVAVVIAETLNQAKDAAELIEVDYEALPAVVKAANARTPGAERARSRSMLRIRACACGERRKTACACPGSVMSSVNRLPPVRKR